MVECACPELRDVFGSPDKLAALLQKLYVRAAEQYLLGNHIRLFGRANVLAAQAAMYGMMA